MAMEVAQNSVPPQNPHSSASLYVGNIYDATEAQLFETFNKVGSVMSIRVLRDNVTRRPLGYAYVNYYSMQDAERALDTLNYTMVKGNQCRIMWSQRDPGLRKSGVGNVFIKNLDKSIDNRSLHDTFSAFGNILSCKVVLDEKGESRGYGYVHYETADAADKAIARVNGLLIEGKKVYVAHHVSRKERVSKAEELRKNFTNVYIKNLDESITDQELLEMFEKFGEVTSFTVAKDEQGKSRGFAFVNFREHDAASKACEELTDKEIKSKKIYVARHQKKSERVMELQRRHEAKKMERNSKYQGVNLYVKNLDDTIDNDRLREEFSAYGTITSHKLMVDDKTKLSRGFGFVCFSSPEEATKAVSEMNGKMIGNKPIYVALHQRKEERRMYLSAINQQRMMQQQASMMPGMYPNQQIFYPAMPMQQRAQQPFYPMMQQRPRYAPAQQQQQPPMAQGGRSYMGMPGPGMYAGPGAGPMRPARQNNAPNRRMPSMPMGPGGMAPNGMLGRGPMSGNPQQMMMPPQQGPPQQQRGRNFSNGPSGGPAPKYPQRNVGGAPNGAAPNSAQEHLTLEMLTKMSQEEAKRALGDRIYMQLQPVHPEMAGKITGMLLDLDNPELLLLLENPQQMEQQVQDALKALEKHSQQLQQQQQGGDKPEEVPVPVAVA